MICALLVFQTPDLPAPLARDLAVARLARNAARARCTRSSPRRTHRRFVKTHTPLDGIPLDPRATYIVVARHPLDMAVSLYHQGDNLDRERIGELTGRAQAVAPRPRPSAATTGCAFWIDWDPDPREQMDSLPGRDGAPVRRVGPARRARTSCSCTTTISPRTSKARCARIADRLGIAVARRHVARPRRRGPLRAHARPGRCARPRCRRRAQGPRRSSSGAVRRAAGERCSPTTRSRTTTNGYRRWRRPTCCAGCTGRSRRERRRRRRYRLPPRRVVVRSDVRRPGARPRPNAELPVDVRDSIAAYYRRVTTERAPDESARHRRDDRNARRARSVRSSPATCPLGWHGSRSYSHRARSGWPRRVPSAMLCGSGRSAMKSGSRACSPARSFGITSRASRRWRPY